MPLSYDPYLLCAWLDQIPRLSGLELMLNYLALLKKYLTPAVTDITYRSRKALENSFERHYEIFGVPIRTK